MAQNRIQFQPGMSMPEFIAQYGTEAQCAAVLEQVRWPDGFRCPRCGSAAHGVIQDDRAKRFQCKACRHQTTLTAGTVMEATKLPLTTWFLAIYLLSQAKTGLSALALKRQLGVSYPTAWRIHHKLMTAMADREDADVRIPRISQKVRGPNATHARPAKRVDRGVFVRNNGLHVIDERRIVLVDPPQAQTLSRRTGAVWLPLVVQASLIDKGVRDVVRTLRMTCLVLRRASHIQDHGPLRGIAPATLPNNRIEKRFRWTDL
jgi:transposase-like protein